MPMSSTRHHTVVLVVSAAGLLTSCAFTPPGRTETSLESYSLSSAEFPKLRSRALEARDPYAAYRLAMYYQVVAGDAASARRWFLLAAENGSPQAQAWLAAEK
jgi:TPR repeat protein